MNTFGMVYNNHKRRYEPIYIKKTAEERKKIATIMRMEDQKLKKQHAIDHQKGYCPHCHMLLPLSGQCDCGK